MEIWNETQICAMLAGLLAARRGFSPGAVRQIRVAALLHDIGKQKIPVSILDKPGPLIAAEMDIMKTHTAHGAEMLANIQGELGVMVRAVCLYHHERHDGGGYWGKAADEVPAYVSIVSIVDVFTALISERPYKEVWTLEAALEYIQAQAGTQFCPGLAWDFIALIQDGGYLASGQIGQK